MYGTRVFTHFPFLPLVSLVVISGLRHFLRTVDALYNFKSRAYSRYHNNWPPPNYKCLLCIYTTNWGGGGNYCDTVFHAIRTPV